MFKITLSLCSHITKCQFRATDVDERIIECLIANVKYDKVREDLLVKTSTLH